jgi:hypothetical protein
LKVKVVFLTFLLLNASAFCQTSSNKFKVGDVLTSKINNVEILKSPDDSAEVLYKITKEDELIYLGENLNSFSKIKFNNKNGWIDTSFLTNKNTISSVSDKDISKNLPTKCEGENYLKWSNCVGSFTYLDGLRKGYTYHGDILDGKAHGFGKRIGPKSEYVGKFINDETSGQGKVKYSSGDSYSGFFEKGFPHGKGIFLFANGEIYEGNFENGEMNGVGKFTNPNGEFYSGGFLNGKYDGEGSIILSNGDKYVGQFKNGNYHGIGSFIYSNPSFKPSTGKWINGQFSGR